MVDAKISIFTIIIKPAFNIDILKIFYILIIIDIDD